MGSHFTLKISFLFQIRMPFKHLLRAFLQTFHQLQHDPVEDKKTHLLKCRAHRLDRCHGCSAVPKFGRHPRQYGHGVCHLPDGRLPVHGKKRHPHTIFLCLSLPLPSRFYSFRPCLYYIFPFSVVFCLFSTHFYLFCFFRLFHRFTPSFCHFLDRPSFFRFYLCHFPCLIFHVSRLSKCFT